MNLPTLPIGRQGHYTLKVGKHSVGDEKRNKLSSLVKSTVRETKPHLVEGIERFAF